MRSFTLWRPSTYLVFVSMLVVASSFLSAFISLSSFPYDVIGTRLVAVLPEFTTPNEWRYHYMDVVPNPDQANSLPSAGLLTDDIRGLTLTTCVPALFRDLEINLPALLGSIAAQTALANEVIIVMSDVPSNYHVEDVPDEIVGARNINGVGGLICQKIYGQLSKSLSAQNDEYRSPVLRLVCIGERLTAGRARNVAGTLAGGSILSFVDSDDIEYPERNQFVLNVFECHENLRLFLHSCQRGKIAKGSLDPVTGIQQHYLHTCSNEDIDGVEIVRGVELYDDLQKTHQRLWIREDIAHGHLVVNRSVLQHVHFSSIFHGEDSLMIRDILYLYGRNNETAIFINLPLTSYAKASSANKDLA